MTPITLRTLLATQLAGSPSLQDLRGTLVAFKNTGGTQADAQAVLEALRDAATDERQEDRILELLDFVTGFAPAEMRVW
jgi:hypothetical protein